MAKHQKDKESILRIFSQFILFASILLWAALSPPLSYAKDDIQYTTTFISHLGIRREIQHMIAIIRPLAIISSFMAVFNRELCLILSIFVIVSRSAHYLEPIGLAVRRYPGMPGFGELMSSMALDYKTYVDAGLVMVLMRVCMAKWCDKYGSRSCGTSMRY